jgi:hypothetical protein
LSTPKKGTFIVHTIMVTMMMLVGMEALATAIMIGVNIAGPILCDELLLVISLWFILISIRKYGLYLL